MLREITATDDGGVALQILVLMQERQFRLRSATIALDMSGSAQTFFPRYAERVQGIAVGLNMVNSEAYIQAVPFDHEAREPWSWNSVAEFADGIDEFIDDLRPKFFGGGGDGIVKVINAVRNNIHIPNLPLRPSAGPIFVITDEDRRSFAAQMAYFGHEEAFFKDVYILSVR